MFTGIPRPSLGDRGEVPDAPADEEVMASRRSAQETQRTARLQERLAERMEEERADTPRQEQLWHVKFDDFEIWIVF